MEASRGCDHRPAQLWLGAVMLKALKRSSRGFVMVWPNHQRRRISLRATISNIVPERVCFQFDEGAETNELRSGDDAARASLFSKPARQPKNPTASFSSSSMACRARCALSRSKGNCRWRWRPGISRRWRCMVGRIAPTPPPVVPDIDLAPPIARSVAAANRHAAGYKALAGWLARLPHITPPKEWRP